MRRGHRVQLVTAHSAEILPAARARGIPVEGLPIEAKKLPGLRAMRAWLAREGAAWRCEQTVRGIDDALRVREIRQARLF